MKIKLAAVTLVLVVFSACTTTKSQNVLDKLADLKPRYYHLFFIPDDCSRMIYEYADESQNALFYQIQITADNQFSTITTYGSHKEILSKRVEGLNSDYQEFHVFCPNEKGESVEAPLTNLRSDVYGLTYEIAHLYFADLRQNGLFRYSDKTIQATEESVDGAPTGLVCETQVQTESLVNGQRTVTKGRVKSYFKRSESLVKMEFYSEDQLVKTFHFVKKIPLKEWEKN